MILLFVLQPIPDRFLSSPYSYYCFPTRLILASHRQPVMIMRLSCVKTYQSCPPEVVYRALCCSPSQLDFRHTLLSRPDNFYIVSSAFFFLPLLVRSLFEYRVSRWPTRRYSDWFPRVFAGVSVQLRFLTCVCLFIVDDWKRFDFNPLSQASYSVGFPCSLHWRRSRFCLMQLS